MNDLIDKIKHVFKPEDTISKGKDDPNNKTNLNVEANSSIKLTMTVSGQSVDNGAWASGQFFNYTTGTCINYYPLAFTISSGTPDIKSVTGTVSGLTNGSTVEGVYLSEQPSDWPSYNPFSWNGPGWYLLLTVPDSDSLNNNQLSNSTVFNLSATATDVTGATATYTFTEAQVEAAPYYPTYTLPNATVGKAYTYTLTPTNSDYVQVDGADGDDLIWMSLPDWLRDNSQADPNGNFAYIFNGTPTQAGTYTVKGQNQNVNGLQCGNYVFTVTVDPAPTEKPASSGSDKNTTISSGSDSKPSSSNDTPAKSSTPAPSPKSDSSPSSTDGSSSGDKTTSSNPPSSSSKSQSSSSGSGDSSAPKHAVKTVKPFVTLSLPTTAWAYGDNNLLVGGFGNGQSNTLYVPLNVEFTDSTDTTSACPTNNVSFIIKSATGLSSTSSVSATVLQNTDFGSTGNQLPSPPYAYGPLVAGSTGCYLVFSFGNIVEYFSNVNTYTGQPSFVNGARQVSVEVEVEYADTSGSSTVTYTATETFTFNLSFLVGGCIMQSTQNTGTNGYNQSYPLLPGVVPGGKLNCSVPLYTTLDPSTIIFKKSSSAPSWIDISYSDGNIVFSGTAPSTAMTEAATFEFMITDGTYAFNQTVAYIVIDNPQVTTGNYNGSSYLGDVNFQFNQNWLKCVQNNQGGAYPCISLFGPTQTVYLPLTGFPSQYTGFAVSGATVNNSYQVGPNFPTGTTVTCQYLSTQPADYMVTPQNPWTGPGYYLIISLQNGQDFWTKSSNGAAAAGYEASQASIYVYCICEGNVNQWYANTQTLGVCFDYAPKFLIPNAYTGSVGFPVNETVTSQNDCPSSSWSISSTTGFPTGVKVVKNENQLQLSGNPTSAGTFNGQVVLSCDTTGNAPSGGLTGGPSYTTVTVPMQIAADAEVADEDYSFTIGLPSTGWLYGENNVLVIGEFDAMTVSLPLQPVFKNLTRKETVIVAAGDYTCQITKVTGLANNSYISISTPDSSLPVIAGPLNPLPTEDNASYLVIDLESIPLYFNSTSSTNEPSFVNGVKELTVDLSASYVDSETGKTFTATQTLTLNLIFLQSGFNGYVSLNNITKNAAFTGLPTLPVWNTDTAVNTSVPLTSLSGNLSVTKGTNFPSGIDVSYSKGNLIFSGTTTATSMTDPGKLEVKVVDGSNSYTLTFAYFINTFTGSGLAGPTTTYEVASGLSSTPVVTGGNESIFLNNTWETVTNGICVVLPGVTKLYIPVTLTQYPPITVSSSNPSLSIEYLDTQPSDYNESKYNPWTGAGYYAVITGTSEELQSLPSTLQVYLGVTYSYPYSGSTISSQVMMNTLGIVFSFTPAPQFDSKGFPSCYVGTPYQETLQAINDVPFTFVSATSLPPGITFVTKELGTSFLATGDATKAGTFITQAVVNINDNTKAPITIPFTVLPALPKDTKVVYGNGESGSQNGSGTEGSSTHSSGDTPTSKGKSGTSGSAQTPTSSDSGSTKESAPSSSDTPAKTTDSSPSDSGSKEGHSSTPDKTTAPPKPSTGPSDGGTKTQSSETTPAKSNTPPVSDTPTPPKTTSPTPSSTNGNSTPKETKPSTPAPKVSPLKFSYTNSSTTVSTTGSVYFTPTVSGGESVKDYEVVGTLPEGITLNTTTGVLSGNITIPGAYSVKVECVSGSQNASSTVSITVVNPLSVSYEAITGVTGNSVSVTPTISGGSGKTTFSVSGVSPSSVAGAPIPLPGVTGLFLNPLTGEISGTPLSSVTTAIKVIGSDEVGQATTIIDIDVENPIIMTGTLADQSVNKAFSFTPTISGGTPSKYVFSYTCESGLPEGVTFNASTCSLSGVCSTVVSGCNITLTCTDGISTAHLTVTLNVTPPLAIIPDQTAVFSDGVSGKYVLQGSNLGENPVWAITNGSLPSGLNLVNGTIIGETTAVGSYTLTLAVKAPINTATGILTLNVIEDLNISPPLPTGTVGLPYSFTPDVSGGNTQDYYFSLSVLNNKSLMNGLVFSHTNGSITGVPTSAGSIQVVITVTDGKSTKSTATLSLTINGVVTTQPSGNNNDTTFTQLLQKYVTLLTSPTVTPAMRSKAIQCISQATNLMLSTPTSTMFETMYQYQVQYQTTLFVDTNFFLGNSVLTSQDQAKLSGVYNAFRTLVTNPELNVSWDYIGQSPINNIPLLNWLQNKQKTLQQLQTQK